jgi:NADPH:quinone reductase
MKAIQVTQYVSGPQELKVTTLPTPTPNSSHYLIKIYACGTNFFDLLQIQGKYQHQPPLPWIAGMEFAGTVLATPQIAKDTGSSVVSSIDGTISARTNHQFQVGDRVFGAVHGAYSTHILAPEEALFPIPVGWSFADACGLYVTAPTSYGALVTRANTQPGEWVLVHAGAGGVGLSAVQIAKALGATVIATAGSERKRQICLDYGADYVVDYNDKAWPQRVIGLCEKHRTGNGKQGVDVVYDPVGMRYYIRLIKQTLTGCRYDRPVNQMHSLERPFTSHWLHRRHNREGGHEPRPPEEHLYFGLALGHVRYKREGNRTESVEGHF